MVNQSYCRPADFDPEGSRKLRLPDFETVERWRW